MSVGEHDRENLDVFCRFLSVAPFTFTAGSARLESPPKPDASCDRDGRVWYFELVRPVDPRIAEYTSNVKRAAKRSPEGMAPGDAITPILGAGYSNAIRKKAAKTYAVGTAPLDLLIWLDRRADFFAGGTWQYVQSDVRQAIQSHRGRWHTVWVFDPQNSTILLSERCA